MSPFHAKMRGIYLPLLLITVGHAGTYTFLNWLLQIEAEPFSPAAMIIEFGLPAGLAALFIYIWIRPGIRALKFEKSKTSSLYYFLAIVTVAAPVLIAQQHLATERGEITHLTGLDQIGLHRATRYYSVETYFAHKGGASLEMTSRRTGKRGKTLEYSASFVSPLLDSAGDSTRAAHDVWIGITYRKEISNSLDDSEKKYEYENFYRDAHSSFEWADLQDFAYLERAEYTVEREGYDAAVQRNARHGDPKRRTILVGRREEFERRSDGTFSSIIVSLIMGAAVWLVMLAYVEVDEERLGKIVGRKIVQDE